MTIVEETLSSTDHNYSYTFPPSPDSFWVKVTAHRIHSCEYVDSIQIKIATPSASFLYPYIIIVQELTYLLMLLLLKMQANTIGILEMEIIQVG